MMQNNTILTHAYSSKYYDPVKAHEYYMKNRVLKGRQRRSLNEEGRLTEQYAKRQIDDDKKRKIAASLSNMKSKIQNILENRRKNVELARAEDDNKNKSKQEETSRLIAERTKRSIEKVGDLKERESAQTEKISKDLNSRVNVLKSRLKNMSKEEKSKFSEQINDEIISLKSQGKEAIFDIKQKTSAEASGIKSDLKTANAADKDSLKVAKNTSRNQIKQIISSLTSQSKSEVDSAKEKHKSYVDKVNGDAKTASENVHRDLMRNEKFLEAVKAKKGRSGRSSKARKKKSKEKKYLNTDLM